MRYEAAPCRLLILLAAAALGWAVVICTVVFLPQALVGVAVAGVLVWRKGQRPVDLSAAAADLVAPTGPVASAAAGTTRVRAREDVLQLAAHSF